MDQKQENSCIIEQASKEFDDRWCELEVYDTENIIMAIREVCKQYFIQGAKWQKRQSQWINLQEPHEPFSNDAMVLVRLEDGTIRRYEEDWQESAMMVTHVFVVPPLPKI